MIKGIITSLKIIFIKYQLVTEEECSKFTMREFSYIHVMLQYKLSLTRAFISYCSVSIHYAFLTMIMLSKLCVRYAFASHGLTCDTAIFISINEALVT